MATYSNSAREVEMPNGDVVVLHSAPTGGANTTSNIKKFKYDDNGHVTESTDANATDLNLNSYSTPTTGSTAIGTSDAVQTAIGKLDHQSQIDQSNILYALDKVGKNLLDFANLIVDYISSDFTYSKSDDSISVRSTLGWHHVDYRTPKVLSPGTYVFSAKVIDVSIGGNQANIYILKESNNFNNYLAKIRITENGTVEGEFTLTDAQSVIIAYYANWGATAATNTFTASENMICTKSQYSISAAYEPYGAPNYDLTQLQSEDRNALVEVIDKGAKNQLTIPDIETLKTLNIEAGVSTGTWSGNSFTYKGVTFTINYADNTITTSGTSTIDHERIVINKFTFKSNNDYMISGCPSGGSYSGYSIAMLNYNNRDTGGGLEVEGDNVTRYLVVYAQNSGTDMSGLTFKPMICTPDEWKISRNHAPYALPNSDLTQLESEDRAALAEVVDSGAKNRIPTHTPETVTSDTATVTYNADGSITAERTTTASAGTAYEIVRNDLPLPVGEYIFSAGIIMPTNCTLIFNHADGTATYINPALGDTHIPVTITATNQITRIYLWLAAAITEEFTIYPMICSKAEWDLSHDHVPYRPSCEELAVIAENGSKNLFKPEYLDVSQGGTTGSTTAIIQNDGSIKINHAASTNAIYVTMYPTTVTGIPWLELPSEWIGKYFSGLTKTISGVHIFMEFSNDGSTRDESIDISLAYVKVKIPSGYQYYRWKVKVDASVVVTDYVVKPMIADLTVYNVLGFDQPPSFTNEKLTALIADLTARVEALEAAQS